MPIYIECPKYPQSITKFYAAVEGELHVLTKSRSDERVKNYYPQQLVALSTVKCYFEYM